MKSEKAGIEIWSLDGTGLRCAVSVDGRVRYVGSVEQCRLFASTLVPQDDRERQDQMLVRAIR
jgi:hypothetical protein